MILDSSWFEAVCVFTLVSSLTGFTELVVITILSIPYDSSFISWFRVDPNPNVNSPFSSKVAFSVIVCLVSR